MNYQNLFPILLFLLATTFYLQAQTSPLAPYHSESAYTYIYKLTNEQASQIYEKDKIDIKNGSYFTQLIDSFARNNSIPSLANGHYLLIKAEEHLIRTTIKTATTFVVNVLNDYKTCHLKITHQQTGATIEQAKVSYKNKQATYDANTETYFFKGKIEGQVKIQVSEEVAFFMLTRNKRWRSTKKSASVPNQSWFHFASKKQDGYIAMNQPQYRLGDTVKLKVQAIRKNFKPYTKAIKLVMKEVYGRTKLNLTLEPDPTKPGTYLHEFVLGDSLNIDTRYTLAAKTQKGQKISSNQFYLADYQLDENTYTFKSEKDIYHQKEPIVFYASGKNASGQAILDGKIDLFLWTSEIKECHSKEVFVQDTLWTHEQYLDPLGETKIVIPDSIIPDATLRIGTHAQFRNANNELQEQSKFITINNNKIDFTFDLVGDKLLVNLVQNGDTLNRSKVQLIQQQKSYPSWHKYEIANDTIDSQQIAVPASITVNPNCVNYVLYSMEDSLTKTFSLEGYNAGVAVIGNRKDGIVNLEIENPRKIAIRYLVYKANKKLTEGICKENKKWQYKDNSTANYQLFYQYVWGGESYEFVETINAYENEINITLKTRPQIYPGQKEKIRIETKNYLGKVLPHTDLTALSTNNLFRKKNIPNLPYPRIKKKQIKKKYNYDVASHILGNKTSPLNRHAKWRKKLQLNTHDYYQFLYPQNGFYTRYDTLIRCTDNNKDNCAQFAPFIIKDGNFENIYLIYYDDRLIYHKSPYNNTPYSFVADTGKHLITLRTKHMKYEVPIELKNNQKLSFSIDALRLPDTIKTTSVYPKYSQEEITDIKENTLYIENNFKNKGAWLIDGDLVQKVNNSKHISAMNVRGETSNDIDFILQDNYSITTDFEPGYEYTFSEKKVKLKSINDWPFSTKIKKKYTDQNAIKQSLDDVALSKADIVFKSPEKLTYLFNKVPISKKETGNYQFEYLGDSTIYFITLQKLNSAQNTNKDTLIFHGNKNTYSKLEKGNYQITFFTPTGNYFQKNIHIKPHGTLCEKLLNIQFKKDDNKVLKKIKQQLAAREKLTDLRKAAIIYKRIAPPIINTFGNINYKNKLKSTGVIEGIVTDDKTGETIAFANVSINVGGQIIGTQTDFDGYYIINPIKPIPIGTYSIKVSYIGYITKEISNITVGSKKIIVDVTLAEEEMLLEAVSVISYKVPLLHTGTEKTFSFSRNRGGGKSKKIKSMPTPRFNGASKVAGIYDASGEAEQDANSLITNNEAARSTDLLSANNPNSLRSNFKDYAFWQPLLMTDENGIAEFEVTYPDDLTTWNNYVLGMNLKNKQSGLAKSQTKARKDLTATLALPRFLIAGDESNIIGKSLNYTDKPLAISSSFLQDKQLISSTDTTFNNRFIEQIPIKANAADDTLTYTYQLKMDNGYFDGEQREIPIFPVGVEEAIGQFMVLEKDHTFEVNLNNAEGEIKLYAETNALENLIHDLEHIQQYEYACMEQTASKVKALVLEKQVRTHLGQPFGIKKELHLKKLIKKLQKSQKNDDTWGWWPNSNTNFYMTTYIIEALVMAHNAGYNVRIYNASIDKMYHYKNNLSGSELLYTLKVMSDLRLMLTQRIPRTGIDNDAQLKKIKPKNLYQQLCLIKIRQNLGLPYDINEVLSQKQQDIMGNYYWGEDNTKWYNNEIQNTLLAYQIIRRNKAIKNDYLPKIRNYLLNKKKHSTWRNTRESAEILQTILPDFMPKKVKDKTKEKGNKKSYTWDAAMVVNGKKITQFPYERRYAQGSTNNNISIQKTGDAPIYFTAYQKRWNKKLPPKTNLYDIQTLFKQNGKTTQTLVAGKPTKMQVSITAKKAADYVMIEIPIPGACSYGVKNKAGKYVSHQEFFKHKTVLFCEALPKGTHTFTINLEPRFSGNFTLNPAKVSLMYYPTLYGVNEGEKMEVR